MYKVINKIVIICREIVDEKIQDVLDCISVRYILQRKKTHNTENHDNKIFDM